LSEGKQAFISWLLFLNPGSNQLAQSRKSGAIGDL